MTQAFKGFLEDTFPAWPWMVSCYGAGSLTDVRFRTHRLLPRTALSDVLCEVPSFGVATRVGFAPNEDTWSLTRVGDVRFVVFAMNMMATGHLHN